MPRKPAQNIGITPGSSGGVAEVTLTLDTSQYASGDVLSDTVEVPIGGVPGGAVTIVSVTVIDEDDQGAAFTLFFLKSNVSLGSKNSAPNISDANSREVTGKLDVATTDYTDLGGTRVAMAAGTHPQVLLDGNGSFFVSTLNGSGTPTYTASGLKLKIGYAN